MAFALNVFSTLRVTRSHFWDSNARLIVVGINSTISGASWHSPNETPPIPALRPQNNGNDHHPSPTEWAPAEICWPPRDFAGGGVGGRSKTPHGGQLTPQTQRQRTASHLQVPIAYDRPGWVLSIRLTAAHGPATFGQQMPNPFIKVYLLPERKVSNKRRTKYVPVSCNPVWDLLVEYSSPPNQLERRYLYRYGIFHRIFNLFFCAMVGPPMPCGFFCANAWQFVSNGHTLKLSNSA
ncbi:hypothetical protein niasHT_014555 [Heterodera trifolii]|uniref:C2 domain-containing protein n=1 Tax=Heterodera trifolii TaxID=157864 RepID=A0ABD2LHP7_9BILA